MQDFLVMGSLNSQQELKREAHQWVVRLTSGRATTADAEAVRLWCNRSQDHAKAFAEASNLWDRLEPAARRLASRRGAQLTVRPRGVAGRRAVLTGGLAASAAALGYLMVRPPLELWPSLADLAADYRTGAGQQRSVTVGVGLALELNTRTSINVQRNAEGIHAIDLVSGEVAVATDTEGVQHVVVSANGGQTTATSARFDVRCDSGTTSVTCLEGEVAVAFRGQAVTLQESRQVSYGEAGLGSAVAVNSAVVTAWRDGRLVFDGVPLAQVIADVNRYWPGRIILANQQLGHRAVDATLPLDRLDEIVVLMESAYGAKVTTLPGNIVILS
jgi:transmembrane sensor